MTKQIITGVAAVLVSLAVFVIGFAPKAAPAPAAGAVSSPDISSPYLSFGGVRQWAASSELRSGTSTLCAVQSPAASSTLVSATVRVNYASTSATYLEIGKATTAFATTTGLGIVTIAASGAGTLIASSTGNGTLYNTELAPNTWINAIASFATAASSATAPRGRCNVVFREI